MRCANCGNEDENTLWDEGDMEFIFKQRKIRCLR